MLFSLYSNAYFVWILLKLHFTNTFSVYSGAGCLPSLSACLLPGDCHLLIQTSRRFPQLDQYLPAACLSLLQGTNTTWSLLCAYICVCFIALPETWRVCLCVCACRWLKCWCDQSRVCFGRWWSTWTRWKSRYWRVWPGPATPPFGRRFVGPKTKFQPASRSRIYRKHHNN